MNLLDLAIVALVGLSVWSGHRRGAALQLFSYVGLVAGLLAGTLLAPRVAKLAEAPQTQAIVALVTMLVMAGIGDALGWLAGSKIWRRARASRLSSADAAAGSVIAVAVTLLATWFLAFNLVQGPFPGLSRQIRGSAIVRTLDTALPQPPSLLGQVRRFLNRFGFPEVFQGLPPAPAGPVKGPTKGEAGVAIAAADQSTLKIVGEACDRIQEGSGFVVAQGYVVTNAHVVAGVREPQVQQQDGASFPAATVLFDPGLDLAVLRVNGDPAEPLPMAQEDLGRGAKGAVLGYPGGGSLTGRRAAVRQKLDALGKDIYGRRAVEREVYELQAVVRPGNSGGPFVMLDGTVAGVVFAASTTEGNVGYAITATQAMPRIREGIARNAAVDTGPCT